MKTSSFLLLLACHLLLSQQVFAQPIAGRDNDFKRFGLQVGVNLSNMNFNKGTPPPTTPIAASWQTGFNIGFIVRVPLGDRWLLQPEYNYGQKSGTDKSIATKYRLDWFSMPVLLHYKITEQFSVYAGPEAALLVHAAATNNGVKTNITHDTEERSLSAIGGVEFRITPMFFVSARYGYGFNHIGIGQRSNVKEFKYETAGLTVGVSL